MNTLHLAWYLVAAIVIFASGCLRLAEDVSASFQIVLKVDSPNRKWVAVLFTGGGGATTSSGTGVAILPWTESPVLQRGRGVVCSQDGVVDGAALQWMSENVLVIRGMPDPALGEIYRQESQWESVIIQYESNLLKMPTTQQPTSRGIGK